MSDWLGTTVSIGVPEIVGLPLLTTEASCHKYLESQMWHKAGVLVVTQNGTAHVSSFILKKIKLYT